MEDAFTVVVPSSPGYGFSQAPPAPITPRQVGHLWHQLMTQVPGFRNFFVQGGDWGSIISSWMAYVMMYWIPGPNAASWYYISILEQGARRLPRGECVNVPTGVPICPLNMNPPQPSSLIERSYRLVRRTDAADGGHFGALEQPALFVQDVREFFRAFR